jgi:tryptophan 2,3-dioxygenase
MAETGPTLAGKGRTDYERYIRTEELLSLQKCPGEMVHPEESLFQVTHQAAELWLKQINYEIDRVAALTSEGAYHHASDLIARARMILDLLRDQIVIVETMAPADYHVIRLNALGRGSGQESPGFAALLDAGQRLWAPFSAKLGAAGLTTLELFRRPRENYELYRLAQGMMDYDAAFMKWRYTHLRLALRIIGARVRSLKNVPVMQLEAGTREPLFPVLWETVSDLTDETRPEY